MDPSAPQLAGIFDDMPNALARPAMYLRMASWSALPRPTAWMALSRSSPSAIGYDVPPGKHCPLAFMLFSSNALYFAIEVPFFFRGLPSIFWGTMASPAGPDPDRKR